MARKRQRPSAPKASVNHNAPKKGPEIDPTTLDELPITYQQLIDFYNKQEVFNPYNLRAETMKRIEKITKRPLICYVTKTRGRIQPNDDVSISDGDLMGWDDLTRTIEGSEVDIFLVSNGGSPEVTERAVYLLREKFDSVRFIVPHNAYSAATLLCFAGDEIVMGPTSTLGPIDPQIGGIPARTILRAFEELEERLKDEGPGALTAYIPLLEKYDLHILELCKTFQELSKDLAQDFLSAYMLAGVDDLQIEECVEFFSNFDEHKSHGRSINRSKAKEQGLKIVDVEDIPGLADYVRSLYTQFDWVFDASPFCKLFENAYGIAWGRKTEAQVRPGHEPQANIFQ